MIGPDPLGHLIGLALAMAGWNPVQIGWYDTFRVGLPLAFAWGLAIRGRR